MERIAVVDLGSNSVRMTITRLYGNGSYRMVESARAMVRLCEGMGPDCLLRPRPMERTLHALLMFTRLMAAHQVSSVYPVATAAVRMAANAEGFLAQVKEQTGLAFLVISGDEEAELDWLGVSNTISLRDYVMVDIGGASTEIAMVRERAIAGKASIPWGAVNLTERFGLRGKASRLKTAAAEEAVREQLHGFDWLARDPAVPVVGLGGTVRALAKADRMGKDYPLEGLHQYEMSTHRLFSWMDGWAGLRTGARKDLTVIGKERLDILSGAIIPLRVLLGHTGAERLMVSGNGIREGLFFRHLGRVCNWNSALVDDVRAHAVENLMKLHEADTLHSWHVHTLALLLFDQLQPLHSLGPGPREWLAYAALLHDAGTHLDYYNHQQHGYYIVLNSELNGFSHREKVLVALLCGMHRINAGLDADLGIFDMLLEEGDVPVLGKLSLCLMMAEQLDRSESGAVRDVRLHIGAKTVRMVADAETDIVLEMESAALCGGAFEKEYGRKLRIARFQGINHGMTAGG
jgi:exopolyphosphatase / guanosine-5'-triphosphate,3'-diphosphate pyrophosphatase